MTPINFGLRPIGRALRRAVSAVTFLFRDDFTTNESAPIASPRTAEPGPGTLDIFDAGNNLSITGQEVVASGINSAGDPKYSDITRTRSIGLLYWNTITPSSVGSSYGPYLFIQAITADSLLFWGSPVNSFSIGAATNVGIHSEDVELIVVIIARSTGAFYLVKSDIYAEYSLLYVSVEGSYDIDFTVMAAGAAGRLWSQNSLRVSQLPTPWDTDYGIATERLAGERTAGDTFTHEADCSIEFEVATLPSSTSNKVSFRNQDTENTWIIQCAANGSLFLVERVSSSDTIRGSAASGTISNGSRIVVIAEGTVIKVYIDDVLKITYSNAENFKTLTAGTLRQLGTSGSVSDIISWPRTLSGDAKDALDAVADA